MANDTMQNAPAITIQTSADLERVAGDQLPILLSGNIDQVREATRAIRERLQRENPQATIIFSDNIVNQVLNAHTVQNDTPFKDERQVQEENPFGSLLGSFSQLAGGTGAIFVNDNAQELQGHLELLQQERLHNEFQELLTQMASTNLSPEEKTNLIRQKLSQLSSRSVLQEQKEILKQQLREEKGIRPLTPEEQAQEDSRNAKLDTTTEGVIKEQEETEQQEQTSLIKNNINKSNPIVSEDEKQLENVVNGFNDVEKRLADIKGRTPEDIERIRDRLISEQQQLLDQYVRYKQRKVTAAGKGVLLSKDGKDKLITRKTAGRLTKHIQATQKQKAEEDRRKKEKEEEKKQQQDTILVRKVIGRAQENQFQVPSSEPSTFDSAPEGFGQTSLQAGEGGFNPIRLVRNLFGSSEGGGGFIQGAGGVFRGTGAGAVEGLGGAAPFIIAGIIILLLIILIIIVIMNNHGTTNEQVTEVFCGDDVTAAAAVNAESFRTELRNRYHVDIIVDPSLAKDHTNVEVEKEIYSTICLLFGNNGGSDLYQPTTLNTFGKLTVGTEDERQREKDMKIHYYVQPEDPKKTCSITKDTATQPNNAFWDINNPEQCLTQPGILSYIFAQNLAETLILQQQYIHNGAISILDNFVKNVLNTAGAMPSYICSNKPNSESCFGDMVAEYLLWGRLFTNRLPAVSTSPPLNSPTPTPIRSSPTITSVATNSTPSLENILSPIGNYPQTWPLYYGFARVNLFDEQQFFIAANDYTRDIAGLVAIIKDVETCEINQDNGKYSPPNPGCVNLLAIPAPLKDALNATFPDFQCGQFIWAIQRFVLGWKDFPADVGSVYDWYIINPDHSLAGYTFYCNPYDPQISCSANKQGANFLSEGDIIVYGKANPSQEGADPGHIAIIVHIDKDTNGLVSSFRVAEANYRGGVTWQIRTTSLDDNLGRGAYILGWWRYNHTAVPKQPGVNIY